MQGIRWLRKLQYKGSPTPDTRRQVIPGEHIGEDSGVTAVAGCQGFGSEVWWKYLPSRFRHLSVQGSEQSQGLDGTLWSLFRQPVKYFHGVWKNLMTSGRSQPYPEPARDYEPRCAATDSRELLPCKLYIM